MFMFAGFGFQLLEDWFGEDLFSCKHDVQKVIIPSKESSTKFEKILLLLPAMPWNHLQK